MQTIPDQIEAFIARWTPAEQAERTNAQPFLIDLCDLLGLPRPEPAQGGAGAYRFERNVTHRHEDDHQSIRRIDLYKSGCFILEAKQGANAVAQQSLFTLDAETARRQTIRNSQGWAQHMLKARFQAEGYVRDLPPHEVSPPFLIVCDICFCFDVYSDFSLTGRNYAQFPDRDGFRILLDALANLEAGEGDRLALAGTSVDPHQFLGLEKKPRAVPVAELVLWIGYLQWHFRTFGAVAPAEPILRDFHNIRHADALMSVPAVTLSSSIGYINADLSIQLDPDQALSLRSNQGISSRGVSLHGSGFIVTPAQARGLGLGGVTGLEKHIQPYLNGRDLTQRSRNVMVIDLWGLSEDKVRTRFPAVFQHVFMRVKPERDQNARATYKTNWWIFGEPRSELRASTAGLTRYIATVEAAKHRMLCFLPAAVIPDNMLVCIASDDAFHLGVLSSRIHVTWALAAGGTLEDRPRYNKTRCFDPFPFPAATAAQRASIAAIAEELDTLRRTRLDAHPQLTMTGLYNVLEKLRANTPLTEAERDIHDAGSVSILHHLHETLDTAVAEAYGWTVDLPAEQIVASVVALNIVRRAEEEAGTIRWLRPVFQAPAETRRATQAAMPIDQADPTERPRWPTRDPERYVALRAVLATSPGKPADLSRHFERAPQARVREMLETLTALGQARRDPDGRYHL